MAGEFQERGVSREILKLRDVEEKQNILKERLLLIGQNLIDTKEETSDKINEIKKDVDSLKDDVDRIKSFLDLISGEMSKFAKKDDIEILKKQAKMFQPLEFVRKSELKMKKDFEENCWELWNR